MADKEVELTNEQAQERALGVLQDGPLAQLGITLSDPEDVAVRIAAGLAEAGTLDDLLAAGEVDGWEKEEGRSFVIRRAEYAPSTKQGGIGIYVIATVIDVDTNEQLILTSGATNVVIQVAKIMAKGWNETPVKLATRATSNGNTVHRLVKGDAGANVPF